MFDPNQIQFRETVDGFGRKVIRGSVTMYAEVMVPPRSASGLTATEMEAYARDRIAHTMSHGFHDDDWEKAVRSLARHARHSPYPDFDAIDELVKKLTHIPKFEPPQPPPPPKARLTLAGKRK